MATSMKEVKQVIVWRNDLKVRKGKMMAQAAHASMKSILDNFVNRRGIVPYELVLPITSPQHLWINGTFTKVVLKVNSEEELQSIYTKAQEAGIPSALIVDNGKTEFNGVPTTTCCAIGPAFSEDIDKITGHLELM